MAEKTENNKVAQTDRKYNLMLFLASVLSPWLMIMFLYTHNPTPPSGMAYVTIACVSIGYIFAWFVAAKLFRSSIAATFLCFFATIHLWVFYRVFELLPQGNRVVLTLIKLTVVALIIGLLVFAGKKLQPKLQSVAPIILIAACAVLVMNLIPVGQLLLEKMEQRDFATATEKFYEDKTYTINETLASPNIYWIHCDGMLGFSSVEKYFGDEQTEFKTALAERDFDTNENASFEALHLTTVAVNVLMNPDWYDATLSEKIMEIKQLTGDNRENTLQAVVANTAAFSISVNNNELAGACMKKDYTVISARIEDVPVFPGNVHKAYKGKYVYPGDLGTDGLAANDFESAYSGILVALERMTGNALKSILRQVSIEVPQLDIPDTRDTIMLRQISDIVNNVGETKTLSLIWNYSSHYPFAYDENGALVGDGQSMLVQDYLGTHRYAAKTTMHAVDMILEKDPDAIIVLQADHGLHGLSADEIYEQLGADAVPEEIWNQVLSAVRVPEQYQNEDFHYAMEDPRNISRWLINSFVGEQYEYLT